MYSVNQRFDINCQAAGQVAFGVGIHLYVGQMQARLETEMLMTVLAARVERIEIIGAPQRRLNNSLRQFASLPVELIGLVRDRMRAKVGRCVGGVNGRVSARARKFRCPEMTRSGHDRVGIAAVQTSS